MYNINNWEMQGCRKQMLSASLHCHLCPKDSESCRRLALILMLWSFCSYAEVKYLIDKKNSGSRKGSHRMICHIANSGVVDKSTEKQQESYNKENPPKPVLPIKISREVGRKPDNQDPFNQRQSKPRYRPIATSRRGGQTEGEEEADPVK